MISSLPSLSNYTLKCQSITSSLQLVDYEDAMMKRLLCFAVVAALMALPIVTMAAATVTPAKELAPGTTHQQQIGTISVWGDSSNDVEDFISKEATHKSATSYKIISERTFGDQIYGTAVLYK